jgi:hypothetical protein
MVSKHGMTSEKASRVKSRGMRKEENFKGLLKNAKVVTGNKNKKDVQTKSGLRFSLKGGEEKGGGKSRDARWQWFLLRDKLHIGELFPADLLLGIVNVFPETRDEFVRTRLSVNKRLGMALDNFIAFMAIEENRRLFLFTSIFEGGKVDCLGIHRDDQWHVFSRDDILKVFCKDFKVRRNQNKKRNGFGEKAVFIYDGRTYGELEVRRDGKKYPSLVFTSTKNNWINTLMNRCTKNKHIGRTVILYGQAIAHQGEFH